MEGRHRLEYFWWEKFIMNQEERYFLNIAGEFAVCSELAKRNIQANLTLGSKKSVDLIILKEENK